MHLSLWSYTRNIKTQEKQRVRSRDHYTNTINATRNREREQSDTKKKHALWRRTDYRSTVATWMKCELSYLCSDRHSTSAPLPSHQPLWRIARAITRRSRNAKCCARSAAEAMNDQAKESQLNMHFPVSLMLIYNSFFLLFSLFLSFVY